MNEWIYRNSLNEYDQKLAAVENERRALQIAKPGLTKLVSAAVASLNWQPTNQPTIKLQRNS